MKDRKKATVRLLEYYLILDFESSLTITLPSGRGMIQWPNLAWCLAVCYLSLADLMNKQKDKVKKMGKTLKSFYVMVIIFNILADRSFQKLMNLAFKKFTEVHVMYIHQWNCAKREHEIIQATKDSFNTTLITLTMNR